VNSLRIGCVRYLNAQPLIYDWPGTVVRDHPSTLCAQLARGELDVALVSSFEFLRNPIYRIVDGVSIASDGPVFSVVVAHRGKVADVNEIALDPAAETSGNLLRCLLGELQLDPRVTSTSAEQSDRLLIGDQAIRFRQQHTGFEFWDLGEHWKKVRSIPFVYALWLVRPEVQDVEPIADQLRALCAANLGDLDKVIASQNEFPAEFCRRYYQHHLRFSFGDEEKQGLRAFAELCQTYDLLPKREIALDLV
jgi:chorismate dehydratase